MTSLVGQRSGLISQQSSPMLGVGTVCASELGDTGLTEREFGKYTNAVEIHPASHESRDHGGVFSEPAVV
jgi:hypothetical protein